MIRDWSHLENLLAATSPGPWAISSEGQDIAVVDLNGQDVTGLAPSSEARPDFVFISEVRNQLALVLQDLDRYLSLLLQHRVCLECGIKMNRQLYCVKCDLQWDVEG